MSIKGNFSNLSNTSYSNDVVKVNENIIKSLHKVGDIYNFKIHNFCFDEEAKIITIIIKRKKEYIKVQGNNKISLFKNLYLKMAT